MKKFSCRFMAQLIAGIALTLIVSQPAFANGGCPQGGGGYRPPVAPPTPVRPHTPPPMPPSTFTPGRPGPGAGIGGAGAGYQNVPPPGVKKKLTYEQMVELEKAANRREYERVQKEKQEKAKLEYFNKADKAAKDAAEAARKEKYRKIWFPDAPPTTATTPAAPAPPAGAAPPAGPGGPRRHDFSGREPLEEAFGD